MGLDDVCNTRLGLGLGFSSRGETKSNSFDNHQSQKGMRGFETLLTLGIRGGDTEIDGHDPLLLCCQDSGTSSNGSVKREREVGSEEGTIEEDDDDGINIARKKLRLNKDQSSVLEENFKLHTTLNPKQKEELARKLNLMPRQIEVWFQNRRARTKLKQTEVDHEYLKNFCKTLTDENRRLHKELQDLKALNISQPYYMQLSTATLSICTSCETISGSDHTTNDQLSVASSKAHFFGPFTNPSATC